MGVRAGVPEDSVCFYFVHSLFLQCMIDLPKLSRPALLEGILFVVGCCISFNTAINAPRLIMPSGLKTSIVL